MYILLSMTGKEMMIIINKVHNYHTRIIMKKICIFVIPVCAIVCLLLYINNDKIIQFDSYDEMTIRTLEDPNNSTKINKTEIIKQFEDIMNQAELTEIDNTDENGWIILCNIYKDNQLKNTVSILNNKISFDKITYKNNTTNFDTKTYKIDKDDYERIVGYIKEISDANTYVENTD